MDKTETVKSNKTGNIIMKTIAKYPVLPTLACFILMLIIFSVLSPHNKAGENIFLSPVNFANIVEATAAFSIGAFATVLVLLTGCIDLSIEPVIALSGIIYAICSSKGMPFIACLVVTLLMGLVCGLINSLLVIKFDVPAFLATVAVAMVYTGFAYLFSDGRVMLISDSTLTRVFGSLGSGATLLGLPVLLWWTVALMFVMYLIVSRSKFGRWAQATGGNLQAAHSSGVNVNLTRVVAYVIMGVFASIIGLILSARLSSASPAYGSGYSLKLIIAAVLGGTSFTGDGGSMFGALLGSLVMGVLTNGLGIIGVSIYVQQVITGIVIVVAVVFSIYLSKKNKE